MEQFLSVSSLPEEIQVDIFLRLPLNLISACRCVCKSWCSLLYSPKFIKNHLNRNNNSRFMLNLHPNEEMYSTNYASILRSAALSTSSSSRVGYPFWNKKIKDLVTLGSCNGLVCLGISGGGMGVDEKNYICIWNPSTGEYKNIKIGQSDFLAKSRFCARYGFGYDSNIIDYKLVRISNNENPGCFKNIQVYTLGSKSWRTVQRTDGYVFPVYQGLMHCGGELRQRRLSGVLLNGTLHWLGGSTQGPLSEVIIVSFNINTERLMAVPFPEETALRPEGAQVQLYKDVGVLGDCLCAIISFIGVRTDVWVMQDYGVRESWVKRFTTTGPSVDRSSYEYSSSNPIWSFENGEILISTHQGLTLYDQSNGTIRQVLAGGTPTSRYVESYMESLVSTKSGTYVEKMTTNGDKKKPKRLRLRMAKASEIACWTTDMEKELCEQLVEQVVGGNRPESFVQAAWAHIKDDLNRKMQKNLTIDQIKNRYNVLRSRYEETKKFMSSNGFHWDPVAKQVVVSGEEVWDTYLKENPDHAHYKTLGCPIYGELCVIFGDSLAAGSQECSPVENNEVGTLNQSLKQSSSALIREKVVGGSSRAKNINKQGKRKTPSTSECGQRKKSGIE